MLNQLKVPPKWLYILENNILLICIDTYMLSSQTFTQYRTTSFYPDLPLPFQVSRGVETCLINQFGLSIFQL